MLHKKLGISEFPVNISKKTHRPEWPIQYKNCQNKNQEENSWITPSGHSLHLYLKNSRNRCACMDGRWYSYHVSPVLHHVSGTGDVGTENSFFFFCTGCDGSFDAVVIANALHIMPHPEIALTEIHRVLKENGLLFVPTFVSAHYQHKKRGRD